MLKISSIFNNYKAYWICKNSVPKIVYVPSTFSELRRSEKGKSVFEIKEKERNLPCFCENTQTYTEYIHVWLF